MSTKEQSMVLTTEQKVEWFEKHPSQLRDSLITLLSIIDSIESEQPERKLRFSVGESYDFRRAVLRMAHILMAGKAESAGSVAEQLERKGDQDAAWWYHQRDTIRKGLKLLDDADAFAG